MRNIITNFSRSLALLSILAIMSVGCKKPPTKGVIKVVDLTTGIAIPGATVKLFMPAAGTGFFPCNEGFVNTKEYVTNAGGVVDICFEHASVINVDVTSGTKTGSGRLSLQDEETTNLTIRVN